MRLVTLCIILTSHNVAFSTYCNIFDTPVVGAKPRCPPLPLPHLPPLHFVMREAKEAEITHVNVWRKLSLS